VDGEKILSVIFSQKQTYRLYNESTESYIDGDFLAYTHVYNVDLRGIIRNPLIYAPLMFINIPTVLAVLYTSDNLFAAIHPLAGIVKCTVARVMGAEGQIPEVLSKARANYYVISYPTWNGARIEHDPIFIAYADLTAEIFTPQNLVIIGVAVVVIIAIVAVILKRR
ncbi:MAG: hypothetical protein ACTSQM_05040, partial [Candidatus Odinarchaeia archaeon]